MKRGIGLLLLAVTVFGGHALGQRKGEPAFTEATFRFAKDPTRVVLHITESHQDMTILSMTVYGDGRLDLEMRSGTENVLAEYSRRLSLDELDQLLRGVVDHGLAEWDNASIHARQLRYRGGRPYAAPVDGNRVTFLVSLEEYQRGTYYVKNLERVARIRASAFTARAFPEIREFQGIVNVVERMHREFTNAEKDKP